MLSAGLLLLSAGAVHESLLAPFLGVASVGGLLAALLMAWMIVRLPRGQAGKVEPGVPG